MKKFKKLLPILLCLCMIQLSWAQVINYTEAADGELSATPNDPIFTLDAGTNTWSGLIEGTPGSQADRWGVLIPCGYAVTSVTYTRSGGDPARFFFQACSNAVGGPSNNFTHTYSPPLGAGQYCVEIITDFNVTADPWTVQVNVAFVDIDSDNDGLFDCVDPCPNDPDPNCGDLCPNDPNKTTPGECGCGIPDTDTDNDNTADCNDDDDDNDGTSDADEIACGSDPLNASSTCETCDGVDNDGNDGVDEGFTDTDGDSQADCVDLDDDNDGTSDVDEIACGSDPLNASSTCETCDGVDNDLNDGVDEGFTNTDGDNEADCVDLDDDNDGTSDVDEIACGSDPLNASSTCEVCDGVDNDLNDGVDEGFTNTDGDSEADCVDLDDDNDGTSDVDEIACGSDPLNASSTCETCDGVDNDLNDGVDEGFTNTDGDNEADCVDLDDDNDGTSDVDEIACGSDPLNASSTCEVCDGVDNDGNDGVDEGFTNTDGDSEADCVDLDDDNDGISDIDEIACGSDPLNASSTCEVCDGVDNDLNDGVDEGFTNTDGDSEADCVDLDDDNDGQSDLDEIACGSLPLDNTSLSPDNDGDNSPDCVDGDDDNDGVLDGDDNCPFTANTDQADGDQDGIGNVCDPIFDIGIIGDNTIAFIEGLGLNNGLTNSLTRQFQDALDKYCDGKTQPALDKLNAFISHVQDLQNDGVLSAENAAILIDAAMIVANAINNLTIVCPADSGRMQTVVQDIGKGLEIDGITMRLYPNPSVNNITIDINSVYNGTGVLTIYNQKGIIFLQQSITTGKSIPMIDLSANQFKNGLYFVRVQVGKESVIQPFFIKK